MRSGQRGPEAQRAARGASAWHPGQLQPAHERQLCRGSSSCGRPRLERPCQPSCKARIYLVTPSLPHVCMSAGGLFPRTTQTTTSCRFVCVVLAWVGGGLLLQRGHDECAWVRSRTPPQQHSCLPASHGFLAGAPSVHLTKTLCAGQIPTKPSPPASSQEVYMKNHEIATHTLYHVPDPGACMGRPHRH